MPKMTPEQEAEYALRYGVARRDLSKDGQLLYDRMVEQRARAAAPPSQANAEAASRYVTMPKWVAAAGTALFFLVVQGFAIVLMPWLITHWRTGEPWPLAVRTVGLILVVAGGVVVIGAFVRFAVEGIGIPWPTAPTTRELIVGGPYRYVRNPIYLASVANITGQALLISRPELLIWAAAFLAIAVPLVHWVEEPMLTERFGSQYEDYRRRVPGWWPRLPRRMPPG